MATVEEVKAGVARFGDETSRQVAQMRALADSMEQSSALLRGITVGSNHARVAEALARTDCHAWANRHTKPDISWYRWTTDSDANSNGRTTTTAARRGKRRKSR